MYHRMPSLVSNGHILEHAEPLNSSLYMHSVTPGVQSGVPAQS